MSIKCLMNGLKANYPCSPVCALFGDCVTAFEAQKKENVRTNADRIRAMSDEELVKLFGHNSICDYVQDHSGNHCEKHGSCDGCLLEWLKQPAEGGLL